MFKPLALISAAIAFANAQDMTAIVTDASETQSGLLAYTTITTACLPAVDPNAEPIFSIQTDTVVESCTYVVNADNYSQAVSTIGATATTPTETGSPVTTTSDDVPLSTLVGTNTESSSGPPITTSTTVSTESSSASTGSSMSDATSMETTAGSADEPTATSEPAETSTPGAAGQVQVGSEVLGMVGIMAVLAAL